jgi:exopolysaccharide biosynthesis protein
MTLICNRLRVAMLAALLAMPALAAAQDVPEIAPEIAPERTQDARAAIDAAAWQVLEPGLSLLRATSAGGLVITAFKIDQARFRFDIAVQEKPDGERVDVFGPRAEAVLASNGGFFGEQETGKGLYSVGLLRINGKARSPQWKTAGGFILFGDEGIAIAPSRAQVPEKPATVLQSKPLMIEPGGKWAMNTNQALWRPRTLLCTLRGSEVVLLVLSGSGMSLYEAGWLMRPPAEGGHFGCDAAIALDGGGSTQLWVEGREDLWVEGETAVHNALLVKRR